MTRAGARRLAAGMVGGGPGGDIGRVHRSALRLDDQFELVAGIFGRDPEKSRKFAETLGIAPDRVYPDATAMATAEAARDDGIDVVAIVTPDDSHFSIAKVFLEAKIAVACEKPLTTEADDAAELVDLAAKNNTVLAVAHCYSAYPMVREAARMVRDGNLGRIRFIDVEHASGWAAELLESSGHRQASWRTDPAISGGPSVVADLGTHALHLARYISGLEVVRVSAHLDTLVAGRQVSDNASVTLQFSRDTRGRLWACMAATGHDHGLRIRVFGDLASLEWQHEDAQHLVIEALDGRRTVLTAGQRDLSDDSKRRARVAPGHPEGFLEAFATFYTEVAEDLRARRDGNLFSRRELSYPDGRDGLIGVQFVDAVAASDAADGAWVPGPPAGATN